MYSRRRKVVNICKLLLPYFFNEEEIIKYHSVSNKT